MNLKFTMGLIYRFKPCNMTNEVKEKVCDFFHPLWILIKSIFRPILLCFSARHIYSTFIWFCFTICGGLIGVIINLIQRCVYGDQSIADSLTRDAETGFFYTFALVLTASLLSPVFLKIIHNKEIGFRKMKIGFVVISIFVMLFAGLFYSNHMLMFSGDIKRNWQTAFIIIAIVLALYSMGLTYIDDEPNKHDDINDNLWYSESVKNEQKRTSNSANTITETPDNISLED